MNVFAMNLATGRVDDRYLQILVVAQAVVAEVLSKLFAMIDRVGVGLEIDSDPVPERNAIFHIEKEFLHLPHLDLLQQWKSSTRGDYDGAFPDPVVQSDGPGFVPQRDRRTGSGRQSALRRVGPQPFLAPEKRAKRDGDLPVTIALVSWRKGPRVAQCIAPQFPELFQTIETRDQRFA
jgi:hypothetical protein